MSFPPETFFCLLWSNKTGVSPRFEPFNHARREACECLHDFVSAGQ